MRGSFLVIFFFLGLAGAAQNLVPNPGFEERRSCPDRIEQFDRARAWFSATTGTPEYFHTCGFWATPRNGSACAGLIAFGQYEEVVEYIEVKLKDTLKADKKYCLRFYARSDPQSPYLIDQLGAYLSARRVSLSQWRPIYRKSTVVSGRLFQPSEGWVRIADTIVAQGGESHLLIGNFAKPERVKQTLVNKRKIKPGWYSYYYIDDVSLEEVTPETCCFCEQPPIVESTIPKDSAAREVHPVPLLEPIYFDFDLWNWNGASESAFSALLNFMEDHPSERVHLIGHTDSVGNVQYNLQLSRRRVLEVKGRLVSSGIAGKRISTVWRGEAFPASNTLVGDRDALNRRVEIVIKKE